MPFGRAGRLYHCETKRLVAPYLNKNSQMGFSMFRKMTLALLFFSSVAQARPVLWSEIQTKKTYELAQNLKFSDEIEFKAGEKVTIREFASDSSPLVLWLANVEDCKIPEKTHGMILYNPNPEETNADRTMALVLDRHCLLNILLAKENLESESFFQ